MRILIAHNRYQQPGGEDIAVANEARMLQAHGHEVEYHSVDNESIRGVKGKVVAAGRAFYSIDSARSVGETINRFCPDIVHVHNFLGTLSPSIFLTAGGRGIPVVLTLHNYRLLCANALLFRNGRPCEQCIEMRSFLPGVMHACYRGSHIGSALVGAGIEFHSMLGTWRRVDRYITLTDFAADKMAGYRIPSASIRVKPNFVPDMGEGSGGGGFALFVGRLSPEKGIETLIEADAKGLLPMPLHVVGDGAMAEALQQAAARPGSRLFPLGAKPSSDVQKLMRRATVLVVPSLWYEGFPMVCAEAYSAGLPILCSGLGGLAEIAGDGRSGRLFPPGDAAALADALRFFVDGSDQLHRMRGAARRKYETQFSAERNYSMLMDIYSELIPCRQEAQLVAAT